MRQIAHRRIRSAFITMGIAATMVSFTLLSSEATTTELRVKGTIARNWRPAYDILVRPRGSFTAIEKADGLVAANHLSGLFGGITLAQWRSIQGIPGVEVAAPVENIGYIMPFARVPISVAPYLSRASRQVLRIRETRVANGGLSRYRGSTSYVYLTRKHRFVSMFEEPREVVAGRSEPLAVCEGFDRARSAAPPSLFDRRYQTELFCYSSRSPAVGRERSAPSKDFVGAYADVSFPVLLAAVDPEEEERLVGLGSTVSWGRALRENEGPQLVAGVGVNGSATREIPVIASSRTFLDETSEAAVERLEIPGGVDLPDVLASGNAWDFLEGLEGTRIRTETLSLQGIYERMLREASGIRGLATFESYRRSSPVTYRRLRGGTLTPVPVQNPDSVWRSLLYQSFLTPPTENNDVQFRKLGVYPAETSLVGGVETKPRLRVVGSFDPQLLPAFRAASALPLETYFPPAAHVAADPSLGALAGRPLGPTMNIGGYIAQPPMLLTTLDGARPFLDPNTFDGADPEAPISVIRIRVADVAGPDPVSREHVRKVAQAIQESTGLAIDITAGSSPTLIRVQLPAGEHGQPPVVIDEPWVKKGVVVSIIRALDRKSLALSVLVLMVTALFLANAAFAAVRSRRIEVGTVRSLGWPRSAVFRAVLGEAALVGLVGGVVGAGVGTGLAQLLHLRTSFVLALAVVPAALVLSVAASVPPAWAASHNLPFGDGSDRMVKRGKSRPSRTLFRMALANVRRVRTRSALASFSVAVGVAATTLLLAIQIAFNGALVGTALGALISIQVRTVDVVSVVLIVAVAGLCVADVLFLNLKERAPEMATLRAVGWSEVHLRHLLELEGVVLGIVGSVAGAVLGVGFAIALGVGPMAVVVAAMIAAASSTSVAMLASVIPSRRVGHVAPSAVLGEE